MANNLEFYKDIYENFPSMIVVGDHRILKITDCNRAFCERLGYTKEEVLEIPNVFEIYHPDCHSTLKEVFEVYNQRGILTNVEVTLRTKSNGKIPVSLSVSGIKDENGNVAFSRAVFHDITDLIHAREEVAKQVQMYKEKSDELEKRNSDLDTFVHLVAHDLRAPLRVISSYTYLIKDDEDNVLSQETKKYLATLEKFTLKMGKMMNDIISYFVLNNDSTKFEQVPFHNFINTIFELLPVPNGFKFDVESKSKEILVNKLPLQQVFHNLFNNAIKHHDRPSEGHVNIKLEEKKENYIFYISDNGPGVPPQFQSYIFEAFKTLKGKNENEGSGLGLAIVKKMIEREGGTIKIQSQGTRGTTFTIQWPKQVQSLVA